ncbi:MAG: LysE family transporter [Chitinophagaceae bacterium]|jgi:threonine/homoserine/homoserine lactone efflux protein
MSLISAILGGLLLGLFMAISVGPTLFAIIKYSLNHSYKTGLAFVLGVSISDIMYVTMANLAAPWLNFIYKYEKQVALIGGGVLLLIGLIGLIKKYKPVRPSSTKNIITNGHYFRIFASGFFINTANPGVIINWIASVTLVTNATAEMTTTQGAIYRTVFFGTCLVLVLGVDALKVFLADSIRKRLTLRKVMYLQKISAACLFIIGIALVLFTLFGNYFKDKKPEGKNSALITNTQKS